MGMDCGQDGVIIICLVTPNNPDAEVTLGKGRVSVDDGRQFWE